MKKTLALILVFITTFFCATGCITDSSFSNSSNLAPVTMKYGCVNPAFQYFESSTEYADITAIEKEEAPEKVCEEFYSICDDVCTYLYQKYGIEMHMNVRIPVYICNLEEYMNINNIAGLYDDLTDCVYLDKQILQFDKAYYYSLIAHECCHMLQAHNAPNSNGTEHIIENNGKTLGYLLCEGICEKVACEVTAWKSDAYLSDITGYIDETFAAQMLEISIPNLVEYFFTFDVATLTEEVNQLVYTNTTYDNSESANITPFEHLLCHIDMCGNYRPYAYAGDNQKGTIYVYSAQSIIEMSCAMARNLPDAKKHALWNIIKEYDAKAFQNSMLKEHEDLFRSVLF